MSQASTFPTNELPLRDGDAGRRGPGPLPKRLRMCLGAGFRAVFLFLVIQTWVLQGYRVYGSCMEPNLCTGERVLGSKVAVVEGVQRGDVVVFQPPHRAQIAFVKRVIGLPGELLEIRHNHVYVDGRMLNEPYLHRAWHDDRPPERIGHDMVYVMGDNRDNSNDSRMWGELPVDHIQAKAWLRYWPPSRAGLIR